MKLFNSIAAAAVIGGSFLIPAPSVASVTVFLNKGTVVLQNDGIPTYGVVQGCSTNMLTGSELGSNYELTRYPFKDKPFNYEAAEKLTSKLASHASNVLWNNPHRKSFMLSDC